jgi:hypothetical protein
MTSESWYKPVMKNLRNAILFALLCTSALGMSVAQASGGRIVVDCGETPFDDLVGIQIQATDQPDRYVIVETSRTLSGPDEIRFSPVFGTEALEKSEFPDLTPWNGYTRKLIRFGRDDYAISTEDECSSALSMIRCTENF